MSETTDQSAAFLALYDELAPRLLAFLFVRTSHRQTAEDLASTSWMKAWSAWPKRRPGNAAAWMFQIARRTLIDHTRKTPDLLLDHLDDLSAPDTLLSTQQLREIREALAELSPDQREVIVMRVWDGLTFAEISTILGTSTSASKMRFARGVEQLKRHLLPLILLLLYAQHP